MTIGDSQQRLDSNDILIRERTEFVGNIGGEESVAFSIIVTEITAVRMLMMRYDLLTVDFVSLICDAS